MKWKVNLVVLVLFMACVSGMSAASGANTAGILAIPAAALAGKGLQPSNPEDFNTPHIQVREPQGEPPGGMRLLLEGGLNVAVFEINGGRNHFDYFLGDEFVLVLAGQVTLTTDRSHRSQTFRKGDRFFVPQGWKGDWRSSADYRELACVSGAWFAHLGDHWQPAHPPAADLDVARVDRNAFTSARVTGSLTRARLKTGGDLRVSLLSGKPGASMKWAAAQQDQLFEVSEGSLVVEPADGSRKRRFHAGSSFILRHPFKGELMTRSGFRVVVAEPGRQ